MSTNVLQSANMSSTLSWNRKMFVLYILITHTFQVCLCEMMIIILSQANSYHEALAQNFRASIYRQADQLAIMRPRVVLLHEHWPESGAWTILPIIPRLAAEFSGNVVIFCNENMEMHLGNLVVNLEAVELNGDVFMGRPLYDREATIIHHFAFHEKPTSFIYPDFSSCFLMSTSLILHLTYRLQKQHVSADFSIDASHELATYIWNEGRGIEMSPANFFCGYIEDNSNSACATWLAAKFPSCGPPVDSGSVFVAVKTCEKYHRSRLPVVKTTWALEVKHIIYFSDANDETIPTLSLNVPNTDQGHCAKLLAILHHVYNLLALDNYRWVMIVDDDSLVSMARLRQLLSCYNSSESVTIGERYGYGLQHGGNGYNYVTLGGGMVLSHTALRRVIESRTCFCLAPDAPDDMTFGQCLKHLDITVTHLPYFHQARPTDYADDYLNNYHHVTFHRHWMIDPYQVFNDWLVESGTAPSTRVDL